MPGMSKFPTLHIYNCSYIPTARKLLRWHKLQKAAVCLLPDA